MKPSIISEIESLASYKNIDIEVDSKSLIKDNIYAISREGFVGFIYVGDNESYISFNQNTLKYAFDEGFDLENIYKCFERKLFSFHTKEEFISKLLE